MSVATHNAGCIFFSKAVPRKVVAEFMHEMPAWNPQYTWINLHMQDAGGNTMMSYRVDLKRESATCHRRFHYEILGRLKTLLGVDKDGDPKGVYLWSMSNVLESVT